MLKSEKKTSDPQRFGETLTVEQRKTIQKIGHVM
jgi:hypothetical protein